MRTYSPERIRLLIRRQGVTMEWLADEIDYHPSTVSRMLKNKQPISEAFASKVADTFRVPVEFLYEQSPEPAAVA
jgi:transcriptional regulator with XRE-family HTH domain